MNIILKSLYTIFIMLLIILALPLFLCISFMIILTSGFPFIFKQNRIGLKGKTFILYKFRTMISKAELIQPTLIIYNEADGPVFKIHQDPRFTPIGKVLSHMGLDELPQLINILKGEMAIFGPRPLPVNEAKKLKPWQKQRHKIKPGILSPWIMNGYHHNTFDSWMKSDLEYAARKTFLSDILLCFKSIVFLLRLITNELLSDNHIKLRVTLPQLRN